MKSARLVSMQNHFFHLKHVLLLLFTWSIAFSTYAKNKIELFENGVPIEKYEDTLKNLQPNDYLVFDDGKQFEFIKYLGDGKTTQVIRVKSSNGDKLALRLPKRSGLFQGNGFVRPYIDFIDYFVDHHEVLERANLTPIVSHKLRGQYVALEEIRFSFDLTEFLTFQVNISEEERKLAELSLFEFAKKVAAFLFIGDFKTEQIVFDGKEWRLLDYTNVFPLHGEVRLAELNKEYSFRNLKERFLIDHIGVDVSYGLRILAEIDLISYREHLKFVRDGQNNVFNVPVWVDSLELRDVKAKASTEKKRGS